MSAYPIVVLIVLVAVSFGRTFFWPRLKAKLFARPVESVREYGNAAFEIGTQALQGDFAPTIRFLQTESDVDRKHGFISQLLADGITADAHRSLAKHLGTFEGELLDAHAQTALAWEARGYGGANTVSDEQWKAYEQGLRFAMQRAEKAAELKPDDPLPWLHMLKVIGDLDESQGVRIFEEARRRAPNAFAPFKDFAYRFKTIRWGATEEEMIAFARQASAEAPAGDLRHSLIVAAHREAWDYPREFNKDRADSLVHIARPEVQNEVTAACERSVLVPNMPPSPDRKAAIEQFAAWFYIVGDKEKCGHLLQMLPPTTTSRHWNVLGDKAFEQARKWCFEGAPRSFNG